MEVEVVLFILQMDKMLIGEWAWPLINNHVVTCDGILWGGGGLGKSIERAKNAEIEVDGTTFTKLKARDGDCKEGV